MSASNSTDKPSDSPKQDHSQSPMATPLSLKSVSDQLAELSQTVQTLTGRVSGYARHSAKLASEVTDLHAMIDSVNTRLLDLDSSYVEHCQSDGKWWRQALDSIISDIDDLRSAGSVTTASPTCGGTDRSG